MPKKSSKVRYLCTIATNKVDAMSEKFARSALEQMAEDVVGKKVLVSFDKGKEVGVVIAASLEDHAITVRIEAIERLEGIFAVPAFYHDKGDLHEEEDGTVVISKAYITCVGLTSTPADPYLHSLVKVE